MENTKPLFEDFSDEEIQDILNYSAKKSYLAGEYLFHQGDAGLDIYIIFSGTVELVATTQEQKEIIIATLGDGTVLGEIAFFDKKVRTVSARTITPLDVIILEYESFEQIEKTNPELAIKILKEFGRIVAERLREADEIIIEASD